MHGFVYKKNNLRIKYDKDDDNLKVVAPDKQILKEFAVEQKQSAIDFVTDCFDFISRKPKSI